MFTQYKSWIRSSLFIVRTKLIKPMKINIIIIYINNNLYSAEYLLTFR